MKIYVAGKYEDVDRIRKAQEIVVECGHTVSFDWTYRRPTKIENTYGDYWGVLEADALLFVNVDETLPYRDSMIEIGLAVAWGKPVYYMNEAHMEKSVFHPLPLIKHYGELSLPLSRILMEVFEDEIQMRIAFMEENDGVSSNGRRSGSEPLNEGSIPSTPAN